MIDIEEIVIGYLNTKLDTSAIYCASTVPNPRPSDKMVIVETISGDSDYRTTINQYVLAIQFYAPTRAMALQLGRQVHDYLPDIVDYNDKIAIAYSGVPYN